MHFFWLTVYMKKTVNRKSLQIKTAEVWSGHTNRLQMTVCFINFIICGTAAGTDHVILQQSTTQGCLSTEGRARQLARCKLLGESHHADRRPSQWQLRDSISPYQPTVEHFQPCAADTDNVAYWINDPRVTITNRIANTEKTKCKFESINQTSNFQTSLNISKADHPWLGHRDMHFYTCDLDLNMTTLIFTIFIYKCRYSENAPTCWKRTVWIKSYKKSEHSRHTDTQTYAQTDLTENIIMPYLRGLGD